MNKKPLKAKINGMNERHVGWIIYQKMMEKTIKSKKLYNRKQKYDISEED